MGILELITEVRGKPIPVPTTPAIEPLSDGTVKRVTPTNADNLSTARQPVSVARNQTVYLPILISRL